MPRDGFRPGTVLMGTFEVGAVLGMGGMGRVDRVRHLGWGQDLAMKSPRPEAVAGPEGIEDFVEEARLWVGLAPHPNVCACHYVRVIDGVPRLFAELVEGGSVADALRRGELGGLGEVLDVAIQAAWGLAAAHRAGVVHQDVKPANLLRDSAGTVKVTDFGLARARDRMPGEAMSLLVTGRGMTPAYASPEQFAGEQLGRRSDIWSWAVTVLELFAGEVSWLVGPAAPEVLDAVAAGDARPGRPRMPATVATLLRACFATDPQRRPADLDELATQLVAVHESESGVRYPRRAVPAAHDLASGLNNRALSLLDLGDEDQAARCWEEALRADPYHLDAVYNRGLWRWRRARITDRDLVGELTALADIDDGRDRSVVPLALVHRERGDLHGATELLAEAADGDPDPAAVADLLDAARTAPETVRAGAEAPGRDEILAFARDGATALTYDQADLLSHREPAPADATGVLRVGERLYGAALHPGGRHALLVLTGGSLYAWDTREGGHVEMLTDPRMHVVALAEGAGGSQIGVMGGLGAWTVWRLVYGEYPELIDERRSGDVFHAVAVAGTDGRFVLTGARDGTVALTDRTLDAPILELAAHSGEVTALAMDPDASRAISAGRDDGLRIWDLATGRCLRSIDQHNITALAVTADGRLVHAGDTIGRTFTITLDAGPPAPWRYSTTRGTAELATDADDVRSLLAEARRLLDGGRYPAAHAAVARARERPGYERHQEVRDLWQLIGSHGRRGGLRDARQAGVLRAPGSKAIDTVGLHPDRRHALTLGRGGDLHWWDLGSGESVWTVHVEPGMLRSAAVQGSASRALVGLADGSVRWWDVATGDSGELSGERRGSVDAVAVVPDGSVAVTGDDAGLSCWDLAGEQVRRRIEVPTGVSTVALTDDGNYALTAAGLRFGVDRAGAPPAVHWWDLRTGRHLMTLDEPDAASVAITPDGTRALTADFIGRVRSWDLETGACLLDLGSHVGTRVALTADGRHAITAGGITVHAPDGLDHVGRDALCWDLGTGEYLQVLSGHTQNVDAVVMSADARYLLTGGRDATARLWELEWDHEFPGDR